MKNIRYVILFFVFDFGFAQVKMLVLLSLHLQNILGGWSIWFENGTLLGGKLGFGFGEYVELGDLLQSIDLRTNFDQIGLMVF
jgi:hypothetical protein